MRKIEQKQRRLKSFNFFLACEPFIYKQPAGDIRYAAATGRLYDRLQRRRGWVNISTILIISIFRVGLSLNLSIYMTLYSEMAK